MLYLCACNLSGAETLPPGRICRNIAEISTCRLMPGISTCDPKNSFTWNYTESNLTCKLFRQCGVLVNYNTQSPFGLSVDGYSLTRTPKPFEWAKIPREKKSKKLLDKDPFVVWLGVFDVWAAQKKTRPFLGYCVVRLLGYCVMYESLDALMPRTWVIWHSPPSWQRKAPQRELRGSGDPWQGDCDTRSGVSVHCAMDSPARTTLIR